MESKRSKSTLVRRCSLRWSLTDLSKPEEEILYHLAFLSTNVPIHRIGTACMHSTSCGGERRVCLPGASSNVFLLYIAVVAAGLCPVKPEDSEPCRPELAEKEVI